MKQPQILQRKRSLLDRHPRSGAAVLTGLGLLMLFSRPIYDLFFRELPTIDVEELKRTHKSRFDKS